jgi:hypothetical protein
MAEKRRHTGLTPAAFARRTSVARIPGGLGMAS